MPYKLDDMQTSDELFHKDMFDAIAYIFESYASDDELNLQPGPSYFVTKDGQKQDGEWHEQQMVYRLEYELMPLIKEYLNEGLLNKAKDEFTNFFYLHVNKLLFR